MGQDPNCSKVNEELEQWVQSNNMKRLGFCYSSYVHRRDEQRKRSSFWKEGLGAPSAFEGWIEGQISPSPFSSSSSLSRDGSFFLRWCLYGEGMMKEEVGARA